MEMRGVFVIVDVFGFEEIFFFVYLYLFKNKVLLVVFVRIFDLLVCSDKVSIFFFLFVYVNFYVYLNIYCDYFFFLLFW